MIGPNDARLRIALVIGLAVILVAALAFTIGIVYVLRDDQDGTRMMLLITTVLTAVSSTGLGMANLVKTAETARDLRNGVMTGVMRRAIREERQAGDDSRAAAAAAADEQLDDARRWTPPDGEHTRSRAHIDGQEV